MAVNYKNVTNRIFDLLVGSDYEVLMGDDDAKKTLDPNSAVRFYIQDLHSMVFLDKAEDKLKLYVSNDQDEDHEHHHLLQLQRREQVPVALHPVLGPEMESQRLPQAPGQHLEHIRCHFGAGAQGFEEVGHWCHLNNIVVTITASVESK